MQPLQLPADGSWQSTSNVHVSKSVLVYGRADSVVVPERSSVVVALDVFDSADGHERLFHTDEPLSWRLGDRTISRPLDTAVSTMRAEETALFRIRKHSPNYGSANGEFAQIVAARDVIARVTLLSFTFTCKVLDDGGVIKTVVSFGDVDGGRPNDSAVCDVSFDGARTSVVVGEKTVCMGLDDALKSMSAGEVSDFELTPTYAERADPMRIRITLHAFSRGAETWQMADDAKADFMRRWKALGNESFAVGNIRRALRRYNKVLTTLQSDAHLTAALRESVRSLKAVTHVNVALCFFRQREYKESVGQCSHSLQLAPSVKAYVRRALAYEAMGDDECARADLESAKQLEPNNGAVLQALQKLGHKRALHESELKKRFGGWIGTS